MRKILLLYMCFYAFGLKAQQKTNTAPKKELTLDAIWNGYFDERMLRVHLMNNGDSIAFIYSDPLTKEQVIQTTGFAFPKIFEPVFSNQVRPGKDSVPVTFTFLKTFCFPPTIKKYLYKPK